MGLLNLNLNISVEYNDVLRLTMFPLRGRNPKNYTDNPYAQNIVVNEAANA